MFKCILCQKEGEGIVTKYKPRDKKMLNVIDCPFCGHRQLWPLLSDEELQEEYNSDKTVKEMLKTDQNDEVGFEAMRVKFSEWTRVHGEMYWPILQNAKRVLNIGSGYGFLEEYYNEKSDKRFEIIGNEIGKYRLDHFVGGEVCTINFAVEEIPDDMLGSFDVILGLHILEHLNNPVEYLMRIKPLLRKGGKLYIEVPNLNSFLCELSKEYDEFFYLYEHVSYFTEKTLSLVFEKAGYKNIKTYTKEIYSVENHINWIRTGKPFTKYNQMFLPDERIEFINSEYKDVIGKMGKGYALICEAEVG